MSDREDPPADAVGYLGPEGTFSYLVARKHFPDRTLLPLPAVEEVFNWVHESPAGLGIVPIENSSGGIITPTVDCLVQGNHEVFVREEITLDVKLALVGRPGEAIEAIYSHFAPFHHCEKWLRQHYPEARHVTTSSTSAAVLAVAEESGVAAIASRENAAPHGLEVLHYPLEAEVPNITQFFIIGKAPTERSADNDKTALVAHLPDTSGSLCAFLQPFAAAEVNLKRIESRPIRGQPNTYRFFVEIDGSPADRPAVAALAAAEDVSVDLRNLGSYPNRSRYDS